MDGLWKSERVMAQFQYRSGVAGSGAEEEAITGWHYMQTPLAPLTADSSSVASRLF